MATSPVATAPSPMAVAPSVPPVIFSAVLLGAHIAQAEDIADTEPTLNIAIKPTSIIMLLYVMDPRRVRPGVGCRRCVGDPRLPAVVADPMRPKILIPSFEPSSTSFLLSSSSALPIHKPHKLLTTHPPPSPCHASSCHPSAEHAQSGSDRGGAPSTPAVGRVAPGEPASLPCDAPAAPPETAADRARGCHARGCRASPPPVGAPGRPPLPSRTRTRTRTRTRARELFPLPPPAKSRWGHSDQISVYYEFIILQPRGSRSYCGQYFPAVASFRPSLPPWARLLPLGTRRRLRLRLRHHRPGR